MGGYTYTYSPEYGQRWYRDLRICSAKLFDRYFRLSVSEDELSQSDIHNLLQARGDRESLRSGLEVLHSRRLMTLALDELAIYMDGLDPEQVDPFITAIFDVGDLFSDSNRGMFEVPVKLRIAWLVKDALSKIDGDKFRSETLIRAIENASSLEIAAEVAAILCERRGESEEPFLPKEEADLVKKSVVGKIREFAESHTLQRSAKLAMLLHLWRNWGSEKEVTGFMTKLTDDPQRSLQLLKTFVLRTVGHQMGDAVAKERYYVRRDDIEPLISMDVLEEIVRKVPTKDVDEEGHRAIECLRKALKRRDSGRPDDGPFVDD